MRKNGLASAALVLAILVLIGLVGVAVYRQLSVPGPSLPITQGAITPAKHDWLQFNANPQHSGSDNQENIIGAANVGSLQKLFQADLTGVADGAPVYLAGVSTPNGSKNLLFVTTRSGDIAALDANTGSQLWVQHQPAGSCMVIDTTVPCYTTSSPALDPNRQYLYSYGLDGYVHKYGVADGLEVKSGGWPELTTAKTGDEKGSSALAVVTAKDGNSYLYMAHAYYPIAGARKQNQGHLTTINLRDGSQHVFNTVCSDQTDVHFDFQAGSPKCHATEDGIWARNPLVYSPDLDKIFLTAGCCTLDQAKHNWSETVFALHPDGTGREGDPLDTYTPADFQKLDEASQIASSAPALLPAPPTSKIKHLAAQSGKDGKLRLLNLDNLSGQGKIGQRGGELQLITLPDNKPVFTTLAVWVNPANTTTWLYVASTTILAAYKLTMDGSDDPILQLMWQKAENSNSPIIVNNVLYAVHSGSLVAFDPITGNQLWRSNDLGNIHWQSPIVVNGVVYVTDENSKLLAYALNGKLEP